MVVNNALAAMSAAEELGGAFSAERWSYVGQMTLLGLLMIFAVLAILWAVLAIFKLIFAGPTEKTKAKEKAPEVVSKTVTAAVEERAVVKGIVASTLSDEELVVILTAAVAAYMSEESSEQIDMNSFRVVSFRRVGGGHSWNSK